ncbi:hypothetical protein ANN_19045 [Periplaneta americana]|uniref:Uncharacterized protein n=1 Tax=Periplaneta americana TaxID=6978 RepID=A0ABQ8SRU8_PERAM|nr:hypothetical protein ANN_19045 [Periplaneta americana]
MAGLCEGGSELARFLKKTIFDDASRAVDLPRFGLKPDWSGSRVIRVQVVGFVIPVISGFMTLIITKSRIPSRFPCSASVIHWAEGLDARLVFTRQNHILRWKKITFQLTGHREDFHRASNTCSDRHEYNIYTPTISVSKENDVTLVGCGTVTYCNATEVHLPRSALAPMCSVFQAELFAILQTYLFSIQSSTGLAEVVSRGGTIIHSLIMAAVLDVRPEATCCYRVPCCLRMGSGNIDKRLKGCMGCKLSIAVRLVGGQADYNWKRHANIRDTPRVGTPSMHGSLTMTVACGHRATWNYYSVQSAYAKQLSRNFKLDWSRVRSHQERRMFCYCVRLQYSHKTTRPDQKIRIDNAQTSLIWNHCDYHLFGKLKDPLRGTRIDKMPRNHKVGSSTESYPAFARIGLRENPGKKTSDNLLRQLNPGHLSFAARPLTVTPQVWTVIQKDAVEKVPRGPQHGDEGVDLTNRPSDFLEIHPQRKVLDRLQERDFQRQIGHAEIGPGAQSRRKKISSLGGSPGWGAKQIIAEEVQRAVEKIATELRTPLWWPRDHPPKPDLQGPQGPPKFDGTTFLGDFPVASSKPPPFRWTQRRRLPGCCPFWGQASEFFTAFPEDETAAGIMGARGFFGDHQPAAFKNPNKGPNSGESPKKFWGKGWKNPPKPPRGPPLIFHRWKRRPTPSAAGSRPENQTTAIGEHPSINAALAGAPWMGKKGKGGVPVTPGLKGAATATSGSVNPEIASDEDEGALLAGFPVASLDTWGGTVNRFCHKQENKRGPMVGARRRQAAHTVLVKGACSPRPPEIVRGQRGDAAAGLKALCLRRNPPIKKGLGKARGKGGNVGVRRQHHWESHPGKSKAIGSLMQPGGCQTPYPAVSWGEVFPEDVKTNPSSRLTLENRKTRQAARWWWREKLDPEKPKRNLLLVYSVCLKMALGERKKFSLIEPEICPQTDNPPRRVPPKQRGKFTANWRAEKQKGHQGEKPTRSYPVLVKKEKGGLAAWKYRRLNDVTKKGCFPPYELTTPWTPWPPGGGSRRWISSQDTGRWRYILGEKGKTAFSTGPGGPGGFSPFAVRAPATSLHSPDKEVPGIWGPDPVCCTLLRHRGGQNF